MDRILFERYIYPQIWILKAFFNFWVELLHQLERVFDDILALEVNVFASQELKLLLKEDSLVLVEDVLGVYLNYGYLLFCLI